MTSVKDVLRQALENALAHVEPTDFPEIMEVSITLSNLCTEKGIHISLVYDGDEQAYRFAEKVEVHPYLENDVELILEENL